MHFDLRQMLQRQFYFFGTYFLEEEILHCWEHEAKEVGCVQRWREHWNFQFGRLVGTQLDATVNICDF